MMHYLAHPSYPGVWRSGPCILLSEASDRIMSRSGLDAWWHPVELRIKWQRYWQVPINTAQLIGTARPRHPYEKGRYEPMQVIAGSSMPNDAASLSGPDDRFREFMLALPLAVYTTDARGVITFFNPAAADLAGRSPEIGCDFWCVTWRLRWPDGRPMAHVNSQWQQR